MEKVSLFKNIGYLQIVENISILGKGSKKSRLRQIQGTGSFGRNNEMPFRQDAQMVQVSFIEENKRFCESCKLKLFRLHKSRFREFVENGRIPYSC